MEMGSVQMGALKCRSKGREGGDTCGQPKRSAAWTRTFTEKWSGEVVEQAKHPGNQLDSRGEQPSLKCIRGLSSQ